ncbi:hypothetical protein B5X24_HaOG216271 [Helicoverpa armigera]|nr:hypothetical protein B5X24_HaOG216271 [Helicoverpa armigera]
MVGGVPIDVERAMTYLGLVLDGRWNFVKHFRRLGPKLEIAGAAFKRLLPNLGGPNAPCRKLYAGVMRSMPFTGARLIREYRTISREAAGLLAGLPPWDLETRVFLRLYDWREEAQRRGETPLPRQVVEQRAELRRDLMVAWRERLSQQSAGHATIGAAMVRGEREWDAVASFCEAVMLEKEAAERQRVRTSHPGRRAGTGRHHGRRVSQDDSRPP